MIWVVEASVAVRRYLENEADAATDAVLLKPPITKALAVEANRFVKKSLTGV